MADDLIGVLALDELGQPRVEIRSLEAGPPVDAHALLPGMRCRSPRRPSRLARWRTGAASAAVSCWPSAGVEPRARRGSRLRLTCKRRIRARRKSRPR